MHPTNHPQINSLLTEFCEQTLNILGDEVIGIYLTGSLSYGDFEPKRSDIDLLIVIKKKLSDKKTEQIHKMHMSETYIKNGSGVLVSLVPKEFP